MPRAPTTKKPAGPKKANYVNNAALLKEVIASKTVLRNNPGMEPSHAISKGLGEMLVLMVDRYATSKNWGGYSYIDELKGDAVLNLLVKWHKFDETKWSNPFAFYTQIIYHCFLGTLGREKKQQRIKDSVLESNGLLPSFSRQAEYLEKVKAEVDSARDGSGDNEESNQADSS